VPPLRRHYERAIGFNMTPMIDVVFLLVIFFMVVSQVVSSEAELLDLPRPHKSQAVPYRGQQKLTVTLVGDGVGGVARRKVGANVARDDQELASLLLETRRAAETRGLRLQVVLRADRDIHFKYVREAMQIIDQAGVAFMDIAAVAQGAPQQP
jgi:biopolymer transport protein ExbD